jgi:hypothetical protein
MPQQLPPPGCTSRKGALPFLASVARPQEEACAGRVEGLASGVLVVMMASLAYLAETLQVGCVEGLDKVSVTLLACHAQSRHVLPSTCLFLLLRAVCRQCWGPQLLVSTVKQMRQQEQQQQQPGTSGHATAAAGAAVAGAAGGSSSNPFLSGDSFSAGGDSSNPFLDSSGGDGGAGGASLQKALPQQQQQPGGMQWSGSAVRGGAVGSGSSWSAGGRDEQQFGSLQETHQVMRRGPRL